MTKNHFTRRMLACAAAATLLVFASPALAAGTLLGKYKTTITHGSANDPPGTYALHFKSGSYTASYNGKVLVRGSDVVNGSKLTLHDHTGPCVGIAGKYKFTRSGAKLKFHRLNDPCAARSFVLAHTFTKVG